MTSDAQKKATNDIVPVDLSAEQEKLLLAARTAHSQRAAETIYGSRETVLRHTMLAILAGAELSEHDSPPEATLQLLTGKVRLFGKDRSWDLVQGDLITIPPERHSLKALEDSVFILTVIRATS